MKILLDAMGGDNSPIEALKGAYDFSKESKYEIVLLGKYTKLDKLSNEIYGQDISDLASNISVVDCSENILVEESPTIAIKKKKDSSIVKGLNMLKKGEGDIFVSAGSTGAVLTGAVLIVGRLKGVNRPSLVPTFNFNERKIFLSDSGANTNTRDFNLLQFAKMADIYARYVEGIENPKIGLLNIGEEENKGTEVHKGAYKLLKNDTSLNFIGNIEARDLFSKDIDIIVSGGFEGNIFVKTVEGTLAFMRDIIKKKINALPFFLKAFAKPKVSKMSSFMNYKTWGGGVMLGIKKPVIKLHGSSDSVSFYHTLKQAQRILDADFTNKFKENFKEEFEGTNDNN